MTRVGGRLVDWPPRDGFIRADASLRGGCDEAVKPYRTNTSAWALRLTRPHVRLTFESSSTPTVSE